MIRRPVLMATIVLIPLTAAVLLFGCGGGGDTPAFFSVSERTSYGPGGIIAFAYFGGNGLKYINTIGEGGGSTRILTPGDNDADLTDEGGFHPAFSPDGKTVAMASRRGPSDDIFLISASEGDRGQLDQLTNDPGADAQPAWSPKSDKVAFTSNRDGDNNIYVVPVADPTNQTAVDSDPANDRWACFNPSGNRVAFQSNRGPGGDTNIWIANVNTGALTQVTTDSARDEQPAWSPDGKTILFTSNRAGDFDIWSIAPDGTGLTQITGDGRADGYPQWRPDGKRISFTRDRQVWTADPDGKNQRRLTRTF